MSDNDNSIEIYRAMGRCHSAVDSAITAVARRFRADERGQGTVEYIGLVLMLAAVMAVVVTTGNGKSIGNMVITKVKQAISAVGS
jgi:Flp pilus assembly pilin Flp